MKSYSKKNIEAIINESRKFGDCFIGNIENGTLTARGIEKIEDYIIKNGLEFKYHMCVGRDFPGYIEGDIYMVCAM